MDAQAGGVAGGGSVDAVLEHGGQGGEWGFGDDAVAGLQDLQDRGDGPGQVLTITLSM